MTKLVLAVAPESRGQIEALLHELTAGRWARWVDFFPLKPGKKQENSSELHAFAADTDAQILAASSVTSEWVSRLNPHVERLQAGALLAAVVKTLEDDGKTWKSTLTALKSLSGAQLLDAAEWRGQFTKIDPVLGPRVAKALLAQLRIVRLSELADMLVAGGEYEYNVCFYGNDPHSGDTALVSPLASRIQGPKLFEAAKLPLLPNGAHVRLFSDGGWSGGETSKRIKCLATPCQHKLGHVGATNVLHVSLGFVTTTARGRIDALGKELVQGGNLAGLQFNCMNVLDPKAGAGLGVAFAEDDVNKFVDPRNPKAYYDFCMKIGRAIDAKRPLGTAGIASPVLFEHSLPKALLPLFMFAGAQMEAADGTTFAWKALLRSQHVQNPAQNNPEHHCAGCPLQPPAKAHRGGPLASALVQ